MILSFFQIIVYIDSASGKSIISLFFIIKLNIMFLELTRKKLYYVTINISHIVCFDNLGIKMSDGSYYPFSVIDQEKSELSLKLHFHKLLIQR